MVPRTDRQWGSSATPQPPAPPNYFSRRVQWKILSLVFLFLGVLWLMSEARRPENWRWMWQLDQQREAQPAPVVTRPPLRPAEPKLPPGTIGGIDDAPRTSAPAGHTATAAKPQSDGWNHVLRRLSQHERQALQDGMWRWRHATKASPPQQQAWQQLVQRLDTLWHEYHGDLSAAAESQHDSASNVDSPTPAAVVNQSAARWRAEREALTALDQSPGPTPTQSSELRALQQLFDRRAWSQVQDNAALRSAETEAWYRSWDRLESLAPEASQQAEGPLNFVQLFSQPKELRGKLVTVTGTVRTGYRVDSREPRFGIAGYYVLGLKLNDNNYAPIVVYCVELPEDFPEISAADSNGQGGVLDEDVTITGIYFKRWLHHTRGGMNLSPLILGRVTSWQPRAETIDQLTPDPQLRMYLRWAIPAVGLLAIVIAWGVYRSSRWTRRSEDRDLQTPETLPTFAADSVRGNVGESLRGLADDEPDTTP